MDSKTSHSISPLILMFYFSFFIIEKKKKKTGAGIGAGRKSELGLEMLSSLRRAQASGVRWRGIQRVVCGSRASWEAEGEGAAGGVRN